MGAPGAYRGPWSISHVPDIGWNIYAKVGEATRVRVAASVSDEPTAHQIAASGALYDALEAELADIEEDIQWAATSDLERLIKRRDRAEAALALARGEQPTPHPTKGRSDGDRG